MRIETGSFHLMGGNLWLSAITGDLGHMDACIAEGVLGWMTWAWLRSHWDFFGYDILTMMI